MTCMPHPPDLHAFEHEMRCQVSSSDGAEQKSCNELRQAA